MFASRRKLWGTLDILRDGKFGVSEPFLRGPIVASRCLEGG